MSLAEIQKRIQALSERRAELQQIRQALATEAGLLTDIAALEARIAIPPHAGQGSYCACKHCAPEERP